MIDQLDTQIRGLVRQVVAETPTPPELGVPTLGPVVSVARMPTANHRPRRAVVRFGAVLAASACLIGLIVIARRPQPAPSAASVPPAWSVVADPAGVLHSPPGTVPADVTPAGVAPMSPKSIDIAAVASTSHGILAVGSEGTGYGSVAAAWRSDDGVSWTRVAHDDSVFGERSPARQAADTGGYAMNAIAEFNGKLIAVGSRFTSHFDSNPSTGESEPLVWTSPDGVTWGREALPFDAGTSAPTAQHIAAGPGGSLVLGSTNLSDTSSVTDVWFSADGQKWIRGQFPAASGPRFGGNFVNSVVAYGDQFVAVGVDDGHATAWITHDGTSWTRSSLPDDIVDDSQLSNARSVAVGSGRLVAIGSVFPANSDDGGVGYRSDTGIIAPTGSLVVAVWWSDDGLTWTRAELPAGDGQPQLSGPVAGGSDGFVGMVRVWAKDRYVESSIVSADGQHWDVAPTPSEGPRRAITAIDGGWIAIGNDIDYSRIGPDTDVLHRASQNASVWIAG